jgi:hypothetical protein
VDRFMKPLSVEEEIGGVTQDQWHVNNKSYWIINVPSYVDIKQTIYIFR